MRGSGVLLHISSLPSPYGIGSLGREAMRFVDFLQRARQKYWQILPIGPAGAGDSPYSAFSVFAGNPYFIDLDILQEWRLLYRDECCGAWGEDPRYVDYPKLSGRINLLRLAFNRVPAELLAEVADFREEQRDWLEDYALFMAIRELYEQAPWYTWDEDIKNRTDSALRRYGAVLAGEIDFWVFTQFLFFRQWRNLHEYANSRGVRIIGDIPIYTDLNSAAVWARRELFCMGEDGLPAEMAGCPPDAFAAAGQLWGNPVYHWGAMKAEGYDWWIRRIRWSLRVHDWVRIDHFRGFESYYAIPAGADTAVQGLWRPGPGMELFEAVKRELGPVAIIAEDLGYLTEATQAMLDASGFPGMKVLQFAFEPGAESYYLPHNLIRNCILYTGTHDNNTSRGWLENAPDAERQYAWRYMRLSPEEGSAWGVARTALASVADTAVVPMQDYLELGSEARMNIPATPVGNWRWRLLPGETNEGLADRIAALVSLYSR